MSVFAYYMGAPLISFFAYYIGAPSSLSSLTIWEKKIPSDQFNLIQYAPPLRSTSLHAIWGPPQISFFAKYMGAPSDQFLLLLYEARPFRLVSSLTIRAPQLSFCPYFLGAPLRSVFSLTIWGPLRSVSLLTI